MSINIASNFDLSAQLALDARTVVANATARDAIVVGKRYQGLKVYDVATRKEWQLQGGITNSDWKETTSTFGKFLPYAEVTVKGVPAMSIYNMTTVNTLASLTSIDSVLSLYTSNAKFVYKIQGDGTIFTDITGGFKFPQRVNFADGSLLSLAWAFKDKTDTGVYRKDYWVDPIHESAMTFVLDGIQRFEVQKERITIEKEMFAQGGTMDLIGGGAQTGQAVRIGNYNTITSGNILEIYNDNLITKQAFMTIDGGLFLGANATKVRFADAYSVNSQASTGFSQGAFTKYGYISESPATATSSGLAIWGLSKTYDAYHGTAISGYAGVNNTNDGGTAYGGLFNSISIHAGGNNIAVYAGALNLGKSMGLGSYSFYGAGGVWLNSGGEVHFRTAVNNADYTLSATNYILAYTNISALRTVQIPNALATQAGRTFIVKDESGLCSGARIIRVQPETGSVHIDGLVAKDITTAYGYLKFYSNGTHWFTIGS